MNPTKSWEEQWAKPYGTNNESGPLYKVPWLAVHGNHDLGDDDQYGLCPGKKTGAHVIDGQPYAALQFNADRNPERPASTAHYWFPDYNYHYHIPELSLELIAVDRNINDLNGLGGNAGGHAQAFKTCGGQEAVQEFLTKVDSAGDRLLADRAANGTATSAVVIQHYPGHCGRSTFNANLAEGRNVQLLCAYGHTHNQHCDHANGPNGTCSDVLTGGGGGCCAPEVNLAGFTAVTLDEMGGFSVDVSSPDVRMHSNQCQW